MQPRSGRQMLQGSRDQRSLQPAEADPDSCGRFCAAQVSADLREGREKLLCREQTHSDTA